jgi:hypothetical protein
MKFQGGLLPVSQSVSHSVSLSVLSYLRSLPLQDKETDMLSFMCFVKLDSDRTDSTIFLISGIYRRI